MLKLLRRGVRATPRHKRSASLLIAAAGVAVLALVLDSTRAVSTQQDHAQAFAPINPLTNRSTSEQDGIGQTARVVLVLKPSDCNGNLGLARSMLRHSPRRLLQDVELVVVGQPSDTVGLRDQLPKSIARQTVRMLRQKEKQYLLAIGHRETPVLLMFDESNRLRLATHTDADPVARIAFARSVSHFVHRDPSP